MEGSLSPAWGLEFGALYFEREWTYTGAQTNQQSMDVIEFPVLARLHFAHFLSLGGGLYYARYSGTTITSTTSDFGLAGSARISIPAGGTHLFVDGRYTYAVTDTNLTAGSVQFRDVQILFGITFGASKQ